MKINCEICNVMVRKTKMDVHVKSEGHRLKHMTKLIKEKMPMKDVTTTGDGTKMEEDYVIMEVDRNDPRFNHNSIAFDSSAKDVDLHYKNNVYTYDEIVEFFSSKSAPKESIPK